MNQGVIKSNLALTDCFDSPIDEIDVFDGNAEQFLLASENVSFCEVLSRDKKTTAILHFLPEVCDNCEQTIQNVQWAMERSGYLENLSLIVIMAKPDTVLKDKVEAFLSKNKISAHLLQDINSQFLKEMAASDKLGSAPQFLTINGLLEIDYLAKEDADQYLETVPLAENLYLSVSGDTPLAKDVPQIEFGDFSTKPTGMLDIFSTTIKIDSGE